MLAELFKEEPWNRFASILWFIFTLISGLSCLAACWMATLEYISWVNALWWMLVFIFVTLVVGSILVGLANSFRKNSKSSTS